jgi:hypothetical protein
MQPLDQPLGLRIPRPANQHFRRLGPAETPTVGSELAAIPAPPPDRALPVPHQDPWDRPEGVDQLSPTRDQILGPSGRDQRRRTALTEPDRQYDVGEPEVTLGDLTRHATGPRCQNLPSSCLWLSSRYHRLASVPVRAICPCVWSVGRHQPGVSLRWVSPRPPQVNTPVR